MFIVRAASDPPVIRVEEALRDLGIVRNQRRRLGDFAVEPPQDLFAFCGTRGGI
jgi:hypothetical protein